MIGKEPNYITQYNPYIKKYIRASREGLKPLNVYKIQTYRYVDGIVRKKLGLETSLILAVGIHLKELYGIRLNGIKVNDFFVWGRKILNKDGLNSITEEITSLRPIMNEFNENGRDLFLTHIRNSPLVYSGNKMSNFRTYKLSGVVYAQQALFNTEKLKQYYG
jgi:hypothetical protein